MLMNSLLRALAWMKIQSAARLHCSLVKMYVDYCLANIACFTVFAMRPFKCRVYSMAEGELSGP